MRLGFLYSRIRKDEQLLLDELRERGHDVVKIDVREPRFALDEPEPPEPFENLDIAFNRCQESSRVRYVSRFCEQYDIPVVNPAHPTTVCADKVRGSLALADAGVPTPRTEVTFDVDSALESIEAFGYPCVLKPVTGSWGRLIARIDSRSAAEAILEHKSTLGSYEHSVFYVQEFVPKPGRDIRVVSADGEPIASMYRSSDHWITNAAKGGVAEQFDPDAEVRDLVQRASDAVGGGLLGVDLMELEDGGYTVHEVNATCEFKALDEANDVDVPAKIVDWLEAKATEVAA